MKVHAVIVLLAVVGTAYSQQGQDCVYEGAPAFTLKYGEAFSIPEACLLLKCRGGNTFEVVSNCPTIFRGAPADYVKQKSKEMGDKILSGKACEIQSAPSLSL